MSPTAAAMAPQAIAAAPATRPARGWIAWGSFTPPRFDMARPSRSALFVTLCLALAACAADEPAPTPASTPTPPPEQVEAAPTFDTPPPASETAEVSISPVGDLMEYEQTAFAVRPGQTVHLTFVNTATAEAMSHNVVVLAEGTDVDAFGRAAMSAADTDYVPADLAGQVVGHTPMSAPGETVEVTFTAPSEPGDYTYVCTFPGHYLTMRGTMRVVAS